MSEANSKFLNRELSWLEFNQRVLDEATDETTPLLERLRFLAITASNLDEFFMVRVGGLKLLQEQGITKPDPSGLSPRQQLTAISVRAHKFASDQQLIFKEVESKLQEVGIRRLRGTELTERRLKAVEQVFESEIFSVLTPMAVSTEMEFPLILNIHLHLCVQLAPDTANPQQPRFALIPLGRTLSRFLTTGAERGYS
jgi:polyphosphate kinase